MDPAPSAPGSRNKDTSAARRSARATYARRRHERWIIELRAAGVTVTIPPEYDGLPLDGREGAVGRPRPYEEVMAPHLSDDPGVQQVSEAARVSMEADYRRTFGE